MGDAMDGVEHGSRHIAKPKSRKPIVKPTKKRKSTDADRSTESSSATSLYPTPSKKARISSAVAVTEPEQSWTTIAQNHTALLESHAQFLSKLLQQSQPTSSSTPALVDFLSRTHEMLAQVKTIEAISPPIVSPSKHASNTSVPRVITPPKTNPKMETLSQNIHYIVLEKRKRGRSPSPAPSPEKIGNGDNSDREGSPVKKIKSAPETPVGVMKSSLKSKLGIRTAGAQYSKSELPRTPTVVTASTSATSSAPLLAKKEVKAEAEEEVSLMEPDDFAAEVAARLKAKEKKKHKLVEGSKGKRRRRSSTVDAPREKRQKRDNSVGGAQSRRRVSGVVNGDADEETRGRR